MKKIDHIWVGWFDTTIAFVAKDLPELINHFSYILITSIDSSRDLRTLKSVNQIVSELPEAKFLETGLVLPQKQFHLLLQPYNLFHGFDEIWLFPALPLTTIPSEIWITGPLSIIEQIPTGLFDWMTRSGCGLGLGDGIGLNCITDDAGIADALEKYGKRR